MSLPYRHRPAVESRRGPRPGPIEARALLPPDWKGATYLALDVETTGLDAKRCRVIEIGALLFVPDNPLEVGERMDRLVDPGEPIPAQTTAIHGIRDKDVRGAPSFAEIAP